MKTLEDLPNKLKNLRVTNNLTQKQIAEYLEVSPVTIQRFEYGDRRPSLENIIKLCDYFDCSIDYLVGRTDNPRLCS